MRAPRWGRLASAGLQPRRKAANAWMKAGPPLLELSVTCGAASVPLSLCASVDVEELAKEPIEHGFARIPLH